MFLFTFCSAKTLAADNVWQSTFGQNWFYELRSWPGQVVAGTWWEASLTPGNTYTVKFNVKQLQGKVGLLVGNDAEIPIDHTGSYSFVFKVSAGGNRRMLFRSLSDDVAATVSQISVSRRWMDTAQGGDGGNWIPKGHYLSFDQERNLKTGMLDLVSQPWTAKTNYDLTMARRLDDALRTPGIKGISMQVDWRTLEIADGRFDWRLLDANMLVARKYGLRFIVQVSDRSFDGTNILPRYFPSQYVLWSVGGGNTGVVSKRWDPYVYKRLIRLYKAIAGRYASEPAFGGIATTETATGNFNGGNYSAAQYGIALSQIVTQTQPALKRGKLFLYMNFLPGGENIDMNKDQRVSLLRDMPAGELVVGGPDITPDVHGMPRSVTNYRVHVRKTMPWISQFCHLQHRDQGEDRINVKSNANREKYYDAVAAIRAQESQPWFTGKPAVFGFDDLRDPNGKRVKLHPTWDTGKLWTPRELLQYGERNFGCDYVFWHYREYPKPGEFGWPDIQPVILNNQYFFQG